MNLLLIGWLQLFVLTSVTSHKHKDSEEEEPCQPKTPERHDPPKIPHMYLNSSFLKNFDEIVFIGDVHGCYDEQQLLLDNNNLRPDNVLKIFSGDITSKGPKNLEVLRFVMNCSSCLTVRGNNDEKTLLKYDKYKDEKDPKYKESDKWMKDMTKSDYEWLRDVPYTISIPSLNAICVHGGFAPGIPLEDNRPYTMMNIRDVIPQDDCPGGWRITRAQLEPYPWASRWHGPTHVFFGHDHKRQLQLYPFATGVDTACVRGHYMTGHFIYGPRKGGYVTQPALHKYFHGKV